MSSPFAHLHCHTDYSLYDGFQKTQSMVLRAKELDMPAIAMTDHGKIGGFIKLHNYCTKKDPEGTKPDDIEYGDKKIKPIFGVEAYCVDDVENKKAKKHHLTILAKNLEGYHNLLELVTLSHENTYRGFPRMDFKMLKNLSSGLIVLSGCVVGEVASHIINDNIDNAKKTVRRYKDLFGDDYYLEIMWTKHIPQIKVIRSAIDLSKEFGIDIVATNDAHYTYKEEAEYQKVKISISRNSPFFDSEFRHEYFIKSYEEMISAFDKFKDYINPVEYLQNTMKIVDKCNVNLEMGYVDLPHFNIPEDDLEFKKFKEDKWGKTDEENYLLYLSLNGLKWRGLYDNTKYKERLLKEFETIRFTTFQRYFLIVHEYCAWAREHGIKIGAGRGSGAGSLILYCLGVTNIDPIKYDLSMDRFLYAEANYRAKVDDFFNLIGKEKESNIVDGGCVGKGVQVIPAEKDSIDPTRGAVGNINPNLEE